MCIQKNPPKKPNKMMAYRAYSAHSKTNKIKFGYLLNALLKCLSKNLTIIL